jgi:hypothetical protein
MIPVLSSPEMPLQVADFETGPPLLVKKAFDPSKADSLAQQLLVIKAGNGDCFSNYQLLEGMINPSIWYTTKDALMTAGYEEFVRTVANAGKLLLGADPDAFNALGYEPEAVLGRHTDDVLPNEPRIVTILQLSGTSVYTDAGGEKPTGFQLAAGDVLVTDGNRPHYARNTGDTVRTFLTFYK